VTLTFKDAEPWQLAIDGHPMAAADSTPYSGFPSKLFEDLALETLLFARQAAREDVNVAIAMFGMTVSGWSSHMELRSILNEYVAHLR
jgi:hypothetical protein